MKKLIGGVILIVIAILLWQYAKSDNGGNNNMTNTTNSNFSITSPAFADGGVIPKKFTCDGENKSPEIQISGAPATAKTLALIMHDPDAPREGGFTHWILYNIPISTTVIKEGEILSKVSGGLNDRGKEGYTGPCPPSGTHHYNFTVYALGDQLNFIKSPTKMELEEAIKSNVVGQAMLTGLYSREGNDVQ